MDLTALLQYITQVPFSSSQHASIRTAYSTTLSPLRFQLLTSVFCLHVCVKVCKASLLPYSRVNLSLLHSCLPVQVPLLKDVRFISLNLSD